ncbi:hypothetical protein AB5I41_28935 [Sphingomonas sp. MMS24-JH45]
MTITTTRRPVVCAAGPLAAMTTFPAVASPAAETPIDLFAVRLAEWNYANTRFLHAANVILAEDEVVNDLCHTAARAYRALLATPASDAEAVLQKLIALNAWSDGCVIPDAEVRAIGDEARSHPHPKRGGLNHGRQ